MRLVALLIATLCGCGSSTVTSAPSRAEAVASPASAPEPTPSDLVPPSTEVRDRDADSVCGPEERQDVFSLACAIERVPGGSAEEHQAMGWPHADFALVCHVVEPCGRIPDRDLLESFFFDGADFTVAEDGRSLRAGFFPGDPREAGFCTPRFFQFRTLRERAPAPAEDWGGARWPNLIDVLGAVRGAQSLFGELEMTTFRLDMTSYCREHPEAWE